MYRRKTRGSIVSNNRGSDIAPPNSTSLQVNRSQISEEPFDDLPKSVTAFIYDDDDDETETIDLARPSSSVINSMMQKKQSTPKKNKSQVSDSSSDCFLGPVPLTRKPLSESTGNAPRANSQKKCLFLATLEECGTEEIGGDASFRLSEDQEVFARKLNDKLKSEGTLEKFTQSLKEYLDHDEKLKKLIMFTQTSSDCDVARGPVQEPMLRLLLFVDCFQANLLSLLIDKMASIVNRCNAVEDVHLMTGILRSVRCLTRVDNTKFGSKLFDLIEVAPIVIQKEIIHLLPELIVEEEVEDSTKQLAELLHRGSQLTPVIIDSLRNLRLNNSLLTKIRSEVLARLDKYPPTFLPNLVRFVVSNCDSNDMLQVVSALRENLPFTVARIEGRSSQPTVNDKRQVENDSYIHKTFENMKTSLLTSKILTDAWCKAIGALSSPSDFRPVDLMVLVLIHGNVSSRKAMVLTLMKNRIRCGVLVETHINEAFKVLRVVANEHHKEVLELSSALLKSFEHAVASIAVALYQEIFTGCAPFLQQDVISDLVMHISSGSPCSAHNALTVAMRLRDANKSALESHAAFFISAMRVLPTLDMALARQLADVVASLVTAPSQEDSGLVEEMQISIRKQIMAWQQDEQRRGVVGAVMFVKHAVLHDSEDKLETNFLLKMAGGTSSACAAKRAFFFDELGNMLKEVDARSTSLAEWADRVYTHALGNVFACDLDLTCEYFPMSLQYSIENAGNLVLPVVALVIKPQSEAYVNATNIAAALRLLWCSEKDLNRISDMMCAAVIIPDASVYDRFLSYQPFEQKIIMDCLFLCANYFMECVNALSKEKTSQKLVIRLKQLIEIRKLILQYVGQVPDYTPPPCQFHGPVTKPAPKKPAGGGRKPGRGKKRKSDGAEVGCTNVGNQSHIDATALPSTSTAAPMEAVAQLPPTEDATDLAPYNGAFRELHCHAYKLLRMELKLNPSKVFKKKKMSDLIVADVSWSYRPEDKPELGPADTLFLLQDYLMKLDQILRERPWFLNKKPSGLVCENMAPARFISGSVKLLPKLCLKLDVVARYCKDLLDANDGVWDAPGCFPKDSTEIKLCFSALLKIIADMLTWRGFQSPAHTAALKDILFILARKSAPSCTQAPGYLALEAAHFLAGLSDSVTLLTGGVSLTRAVQACLQHSGSKDFSLVGDLCGELLKRPWFTVTGATDRGSAYNQQVDSLVRMHLSCTEDKLGTVQHVTDLAAKEVPDLLSKESPLPTYTALNKGNFPLLYRALCEALVSAAAEELTRKKDDDEGLIAVWAAVTRTLMQLVEVAKVHTSRTNLAALLKRSQAVIQLFLSKGLPVMESALRVKSDDVLEVLKCMQGVTRFLHSVCCHSKVTNDEMVAAHVPNIRALCERLTLEVKGMLLLNKVPLDLMPIQVLKNRDIQGNDIMSQSTLAPSDDEPELPAEEEEDLDTDVPVAEDSWSD